MSVGYACLHIGSSDTGIKNVRLKDANEANLLDISRFNLNALENILKYNVDNNIKLFRISSDIIPLASHEKNELRWWEILKPELMDLGQFVKNNELRLSMHPGQYTVINSPYDDVVKRAIDDLIYHQRFLDSIDAPLEAKIILHIGGMYGNKAEAMKRFIKSYKGLGEGIKNRLVIENDDKIFNAEDVLRIYNEIGVPVVFDVLHDKVNPSNENKDTYEWIKVFEGTWKDIDGKQKIHYSESKNQKEKRSHSDYIKAESFLSFYNNLENKDIDIMLEVKDKNLSAVKCGNLIKKNLKAADLEKEWGKYKYYVLSKDANIYKDIRELLKNKDKPDAMGFYELIEKAFNMDTMQGNDINAIQHIWGYFKDRVTLDESEIFAKKLERYRSFKISNKPIKKYLLNLSEKYDVEYLINSLYFYI